MHDFALLLPLGKVRLPVLRRAELKTLLHVHEEMEEQRSGGVRLSPTRQLEVLMGYTDPPVLGSDSLSSSKDPSANTENRDRRPSKEDKNAKKRMVEESPKAAMRAPTPSTKENASPKFEARGFSEIETTVCQVWQIPINSFWSFSPSCTSPLSSLLRLVLLVGEGAEGDQC